MRRACSRRRNSPYLRLLLPNRRRPPGTTILSATSSGTSRRRRRFRPQRLLLLRPSPRRPEASSLACSRHRALPHNRRPRKYPPLPRSRPPHRFPNLLPAAVSLHGCSWRRAHRPRHRHPRLHRLRKRRSRSLQPRHPRPAAAANSRGCFKLQAHRRLRRRPNQPRRQRRRSRKNPAASQECSKRPRRRPHRCRPPFMLFPSPNRRVGAASSHACFRLLARRRIPPRLNNQRRRRLVRLPVQVAVNSPGCSKPRRRHSHPRASRRKGNSPGCSTRDRWGPCPHRRLLSLRNTKPASSPSSSNRLSSRRR